MEKRKEAGATSQPRSFFNKHPANPIYGDKSTGTLFDLFAAPQRSGILRIDFSWRTNNTAAVAFSKDGRHYSAGPWLRCFNAG